MTVLGPGVRVKCVKIGLWTCPELGGISMEGPSFGSIWTICEINRDPPFATVGLLEWPSRFDHYNVRHFVPLDGNEDISTLLAALNIHKAIVGNDDIAVSAPEFDEVEAK